MAFCIRDRKSIDATPKTDECILNDICAVGNQNGDGSANLPISVKNVNGLVFFWLQGMKLSDMCYAFYYNPTDGEALTTGILKPVVDLMVLVTLLVIPEDFSEVFSTD